MTYEFVEVYEAYHDRSEMGGDLIGIFKDRKNAEIAVQGKGWYCPNGSIRKKLCLLVDGQYFPVSSKESLTISDSQDLTVKMLNLKNSLKPDELAVMKKLFS